MKIQGLIQALAILFSNFLETLATSSSLNALLFFRRLFIALIALDIRNDAVLFSALGEALQRSFEGFVWFYNYADHGYPLVWNFRG